MPNLTNDTPKPFDLSGIEGIDPKAAQTEPNNTENSVSEPTIEETPEVNEPQSEQAVEENNETSTEKPDESVPVAQQNTQPLKKEAVPEQTETTTKKDDTAIDERDKDIPVRDNDPHMRPKLKKDWAELRQKAVEARNQAATIAREKSELEKKYKELEEKAKQVSIPKDIEEKLKTYEERLRELDITKDPEIQNKYDSRISSNENAIVETLKQFGLGLVGDKFDQSEVDRFKKAGITLKNVNPLLKQLEENGEPDVAESIREMIRENIRLGKDKESEIASWKNNYESKVAQRNQAQTQQQQHFSEIIKNNHTKFINDKIDAISKVFPGVKRPPEPLPNDTPAIRQAKEAALAEYQAAEKMVEETAKQFSAQGLSPEKAAEAHARLSSSAIMSIILENHVLPKMQRDLQMYQNRSKELESELAKFRKAGSVSKSHAVSIQQGKGSEKPLPADTHDALKEFAKELGIDANS